MVSQNNKLLEVQASLALSYYTVQRSSLHKS
jgi:hypothetical protein